MKDDDLLAKNQDLCASIMVVAMLLGYYCVHCDDAMNRRAFFGVFLGLGIASKVPMTVVGWDLGCKARSFSSMSALELLPFQDHLNNLLQQRLLEARNRINRDILFEMDRIERSNPDSPIP